MGIVESNVVERIRLPWEIFPASLSMVSLAGLRSYLSSDTVNRLQQIEAELNQRVQIAPILQAVTKDDWEAAFGNGFEVALDYYVESGALIWRSLGHDYKGLLSLTKASCEEIESSFFSNAKKLRHDLFVKVIASVRVLGEVGNRITLDEEKALPEKQQPPIDYLAQVVVSTFILSCLLPYVLQNIKKAERVSLNMLAEELFSCAQKVYQVALKRRLFNDAEAGFWDPEWQKGEVEADLDKHSGDVKSFDSVENLLSHLHGGHDHEISTH
jgi:hypothetical protein